MSEPRTEAGNRLLTFPKMVIPQTDLLAAILAIEAEAAHPPLDGLGEALDIIRQGTETAWLRRDYYLWQDRSNDFLRRHAALRDEGETSRRARSDLPDAPAPLDGLREALERAMAQLPPGPYRVIWPSEQGDNFLLMGRQGTPPDYSDGWAIPIIASGTDTAIFALRDLLTALETKERRRE